MSNDNKDYKPRRKPSLFMEAIAWLVLYGPPFLLIYFITKSVSSCIR